MAKATKAGSVQLSGGISEQDGFLDGPLEWLAFWLAAWVFVLGLYQSCQSIAWTWDAGWDYAAKQVAERAYPSREASYNDGWDDARIAYRIGCDRFNESDKCAAANK